MHRRLENRVDNDMQVQEICQVEMVCEVGLKMYWPILHLHNRTQRSGS
jgi:hypothetical protein